MEKNIWKTENNVYRKWGRILYFEKHHIILNWFWPRVIFLVFQFLRFLYKNIIFRYFSTSWIFWISCENLFLLILRGHPCLKSPKECLCHVCLKWNVPYICGHRGPPQAQKNEPKYAQTNQIGLCPGSNHLIMITIHKGKSFPL